MGQPTITVQFSGNGTIVIRATSPNVNAPATVPGVVHRTQGGSLCSYQVGPVYYEATLQCPSLTSVQMNNLVAFFNGNRGPFTYTDEHGNAFTAQFLDTSLAVKKVGGNCWDVDIHLNLSSMLQ